MDHPLRTPGHHRTNQVPHLTAKGRQQSAPHRDRRYRTTQHLYAFVIDRLTERPEAADVRTSVIYEHLRNHAVVPDPAALGQPGGGRLFGCRPGPGL
jgi:hypothetical protein